MDDVAIVLGAGGPVGHAFHTGVLRALADALDWDPAEARLVVGTSAGAQVRALLRAGMSPADLMARVVGEVMTPAGASIARHWVRPDRDEPRKKPWRFSSPRYLRTLLEAPWKARPGRVVS
ncbi:MAG: patatin-like phospholipase family protein, partial [Myxococcales bacterium]|nr:patatin-like phospholipase family protein [Myxococcales bacterium]